MITKQEAKIKISAAEQACANVQKAWVAAFTALNGSVSTNGYGIYHDHFALRYKLQIAQANIKEALDALNKVEWPTDAEYDLL